MAFASSKGSPSRRRVEEERRAMLMSMERGKVVIQLQRATTQPMSISAQHNSSSLGRVPRSTPSSTYTSSPSPFTSGAARTRGRGRAATVGTGAVQLGPLSTPQTTSTAAAGAGTEGSRSERAEKLSAAALALQSLSAEFKRQGASYMEAKSRDMLERRRAAASRPPSSSVAAASTRGGRGEGDAEARRVQVESMAAELKKKASRLKDAKVAVEREKRAAVRRVDNVAGRGSK
jgi:hypothetical protein